jgi:hypothetical protein
VVRRLSGSELELVLRERPYALLVIQTQILYDLAGMIEDAVERLARIESATKPKGYVYHIKLVVDKLVVLDFLKGYPYAPLFVITLYNDGPDEVYPSVNGHQKIAQLKPGETLTIDYHAPMIERLYLDVDEGRSANIRFQLHVMDSPPPLLRPRLRVAFQLHVMDSAPWGALSWCIIL